MAPDYQSAAHRGQLGVVPKRLSLPLVCTLVYNSWQWHARDVGNYTTDMPLGYFSVFMIYKNNDNRLLMILVKQIKSNHSLCRPCNITSCMNQTG